MNKRKLLPDNETERVEALRNYEVLDTLPEEEFDRITRLAAYICETPISLVSLVDANRQWFKSRVGLAVTETPKEISFCRYTILGDELFVVEDSLADERFKENPLVTGDPKIRFYAGAPLKNPMGYNLGTLCVIDRKARKLTEAQRDALMTLADLVVGLLEQRKKTKVLEAEYAVLNKKKISSLEGHLNFYKDALNETSIVAITDEKGIIRYVNQKFCDVSKYTREEIIGNEHRVISSGYHSKEFITNIWNTISGGKLWNGEIKNRKKDGLNFWLNTTIVPFLNRKGVPFQYVAISQDITDKKGKEAELEKFFQLSIDLLCIADSRGFFIKLSPAFSTLLGYSEDELLGCPFVNFVHPDDIEKTNAEMEKLAAGLQTINFENRFSCKDGEYVNLNWSASPDLETGVVYATARNITESKKQNEILVKLLAAKENFLANVSHEIRTPLNAVIGFTELLIETELNPEQKKYADSVKNAGDHLLSIINDILEYSRLEAGDVKLETQPFDLKKTLKKIQQRFTNTARDKGLSYKFYLDAELPDYVTGDSSVLQQILVNLVDNAIKFTNQGDVSVFIHEEGQDKDHHYIRFKIKDTGIGIADDKIRLIFEKFTQAETYVSKEYAGIGLGLSITIKLLELLESNLQLTSKPGFGSEFSFVLAFNKFSGNPLEEMMPEFSQDAPLDLKILLSEDNELNQLLVKSVVENFGFTIDIAGNGFEVIEMVVKNNYDVILMDLNMPKLGGIETARFIRNELKSKIPIIAMTANVIESEKTRCFEVGMNEYILKPFRKDELYKKILALTGNSPRGEIEFQVPAISTPEKKIINLNYIRELSNGNAKFEEKMIRLYLRQIPESIEGIEKAIGELDYGKIKYLVHKVKSSMPVSGLNFLLPFLDKFEREASDQVLPAETLKEFSTVKETMMESCAQLEKHLTEHF